MDVFHFDFCNCRSSVRILQRAALPAFQKISATSLALPYFAITTHHQPPVFSFHPKRTPEKTSKMIFSLDEKVVFEFQFLDKGLSYCITRAEKRTEIEY